MNKQNNRLFILLGLGVSFASLNGMENNTTMPIVSPDDERIVMGESAPAESEGQVEQEEEADEAVSAAFNSGAAAALAGDPTSDVGGYTRLKNPHDI